ncbi:MAG: hypothetical protein JW860_05940 [Sedimentisphaerales bacterium]|nr:hypothetical protein [Sedimentisphaerales bacterium]
MDTKVKKKGRRRKVKWVLIGIVVVMVGVVFLLPVLVSSESGSKAVLARINKSITGKADFLDLSMSWWKGIRITDFRFEDETGEILVKVKQIDTRPAYASILFGDLIFGETVIDTPEIEINLKDLPAREEAPVREKTQLAARKREPVELPIKQIGLVVKDGCVKVAGPKAEPVEISRINSRADLNPAGRETRFDMDMTVAGGDRESRISANGRITPGTKAGWAREGISGNLSVEIDELDVGSLEAILALAGIEVVARGRDWLPGKE